MAAQLIRIIKLKLPAQQAKMGGELGAMLGQYNLNIVNFCKEFNIVSKIFENNLPLKVNLLVYDDKSFTIEIKGIDTSFLIKKYQKEGKIKLIDIYKIGKLFKIFNDNISLLNINKSLISSLKASWIKIKYE